MKRVQSVTGVSERRACQVLSQARSTQRYQTRGDSAEQKRLVSEMHELVRKRPRFGYRRITRLLRRHGWRVNYKRVYRLWRREGFKVPKKQRKKFRLGSSENSCVRRRAERMDDVWALDFIHDRTTGGQPLKWLGITDEYTRECLALEVNRSIKSGDVLDVLVSLFMTRGVPAQVRCDNGPEFIAKAVRRFLDEIEVQTLYIEPGSPWENGYAESFFSRLRDELLNCEEFVNLREARWHAQSWQEDYNQQRPHSSLGYLTPSEYAAQLTSDLSSGSTKGGRPFTPSPSIGPVPGEGRCDGEGGRGSRIDHLEESSSQPALS